MSYGYTTWVRNTLDKSQHSLIMKNVLLHLNKNIKYLQALKNIYKYLQLGLCLQVMTAYFLRSGTRQKWNILGFCFLELKTASQRQNKTHKGLKGKKLNYSHRDMIVYVKNAKEFMKKIFLLTNKTKIKECNHIDPAYIWLDINS